MKGTFFGFLLALTTISLTAIAEHEHDGKCGHVRDAGCNVYGCWTDGGGCNVYGCWSSPEGSCNVYGCSDVGECNVYGCPPGDARSASLECFKYGEPIPRTPAGCNVYGCFDAGGGCNVYGCWADGGGCNVHGCWSSPVGSCNVHGCTEAGECSTYGCPKPRRGRVICYRD